MSSHPLDNPVWNSLITHHARFALGTDFAKRYPADVAPFVALAEPSAAAFTDLTQIVKASEQLTLRGLDLPDHLDGWTIHVNKRIVQMVREQPIAPVEGDAQIVELSATNVPAILRLIDLARPGPFEQRTIEMGRYFGIYDDSQLIALAGERMDLPGYREVSGVCTHPNYRGKGYARLLVSHICVQNEARGT
ncbi:MAG TPA: GNAT family N-acetyltransferase, partial [Phototrophicaceae bacterium]|nr:GNAT family N-acetyltransferase [Phototrophicaceae bacterium]